MNTNKKIAVLGAGSWGTVLAHLLASSGHYINLWDRSEKLVNHIKQTGRFYRPVEMCLPESINLTNSLKEALQNIDLLVCAIPSEGIPEIIDQLKNLKPEIPILLSATKGLLKNSENIITDLWQEKFPQTNICALSGPNLSAEAALAKPMRTIIASDTLLKAEKAAQFFDLRQFKTELSDDLMGVEICGAVKNVIALAAGAWDGLNLGISGKGSMLTLALKELSALVTLMGGKPNTVYSVAGIGDLYITCTSDLSRNYKTGFLLAQGKTIIQIKQELNNQVAEGVWTTPLVKKLLVKHKSDFKVCFAVEEMLNLASDGLNLEKKLKLQEIFIDLV